MAGCPTWPRATYVTCLRDERQKVSAKMSPARVAAFLAALRATGNLTLAAERAKVSRSWVRVQRSADPGFARECERAKAAAELRMRRAGRRRPPPCWSSEGGEELVVTGTAERPVRIARARARQWTARAERRFCAALGACCNVKLACRAVGLTPAGAYNHRKRWPEFAARWDAALAAGPERLDGELTAAAIAALDPDVERHPALVVEPMSVAAAIALVSWRRRRAGEND